MRQRRRKVQSGIALAASAAPTCGLTSNTINWPCSGRAFIFGRVYCGWRAACDRIVGRNLDEFLVSLWVAAQGCSRGACESTCARSRECGGPGKCGSAADGACQVPMEGGAQVSEALLSQDVYPVVGSWDRIRLVATATILAAYLATKVGLGPPSVFPTLESFAGASTYRGVGYCETRMLSPATRYVAVAAKNGGISDQAPRLARPAGRYL